MINKNNAAVTPPMGWNSWDCYGASVNEEALINNAEFMAKNLKQHGWEYIVCDIQWSEPNADSTKYHPFADLHMDEFSRLLPAENRFPSGFKAIADKIHGMGLKFGIHIMRGIPRKAVHMNMPIKGTDAGARYIAMPFNNCVWNTDMYGVNPNIPESQLYYDSLFELYASWGVDYVKVDDISRTDYSRDSYANYRDVEMIRSAIDKCGRDMVLSLSPGPAKIEAAWHLSKNANMWRITDDLWDDWRLLKAMFERCDVWQTHVKEGCWPDCDMLPLGVLRMFNGGEASRFTKDEQRTLMTLWHIFRSPLMMGGELTKCDNWTMSLLTNDEALKLTLRGGSPEQLKRNCDEAAWLNTDDEGNAYIALFNLSDSKREVSVKLSDAGIAASVSACDVWDKTTARISNGAVKAILRPHASTLYRLI